MFRLLGVEEAGAGRVRCEMEGGLALLCGQAAAGNAICVRPENIAIGTTPPARENCFSGHHRRRARRWQCSLPRRDRSGCSVVVRTAAGRRIAPPAIDDAVHVGWDAEDMLVLSE